MRAVPFEGPIGASIEGFQSVAIERAYTDDPVIIGVQTPVTSHPV